MPGARKVDTVLLPDNTDLAANAQRVTPHVVSGDARRSLVRGRERRENLDRGRLARAVGAEQPEDRPCGDGEAEAVQRANVAVGLDEAVGLDRLFGHACAPT
jgi:hypothetical protein